MRLIVNCWKAKGRKRSVRLPVMTGSDRLAKDLRAAIRDARSGESDGVIWRVSPADQNRGPAPVMRIGAIVVLLVVAGTVASLAFGSQNAALAIGGVGAFVIGGFVWEWWRRSTVVEVRGDGHLVIDSPRGTKRVALTAYGRVTVKVERGDNNVGYFDPP
jgi:hypothetical protein